MALWTDNQWSMLRYPAADLTAALAALGHKVRGYTNGKPVIDGDVDWAQVEVVAKAVAAGTWKPQEAKTDAPRRARRRKG
jgi:hypothetical protein